MKYQVLFSLKNKEKIFKTVICCSPDYRLVKLMNWYNDRRSYSAIFSFVFLLSRGQGPVVQN